MNSTILRRLVFVGTIGIDSRLSRRGARTESGHAARMEPHSDDDARHAGRDEPDGVFHAGDRRSCTWPCSTRSTRSIGSTRRTSTGCPCQPAPRATPPSRRRRTTRSSPCSPRRRRSMTPRWRPSSTGCRRGRAGRRARRRRRCARHSRAAPQRWLEPPAAAVPAPRLARATGSRCPRPTPRPNSHITAMSRRSSSARARQFNPEQPPALTSQRYADDFNEVKALGGVQQHDTNRRPDPRGAAVRGRAHRHDHRHPCRLEQPDARPGPRPQSERPRGRAPVRAHQHDVSRRAATSRSVEVSVWSLATGHRDPGSRARRQSGHRAGPRIHVADSDTRRTRRIRATTPVWARPCRASSPATSAGTMFRSPLPGQSPRVPASRGRTTDSASLPMKQRAAASTAASTSTSTRPRASVSAFRLATTCSTTPSAEGFRSRQTSPARHRRRRFGRSKPTVTAGVARRRVVHLARVPGSCGRITGRPSPARTL